MNYLKNKNDNIHKRQSSTSRKLSIKLILIFYDFVVYRLFNNQNAGGFPYFAL